MKTIENEGRSWLDDLLNCWPFCLDADGVKTFAVSFGAGPGWHFHREDRTSLFYNGVLFLRFCWPFGMWFHFKPVSYGRFQCGVGWKLNGRVAILFRIQSDAAAARGVTGPNLGQATAWERGTA